MKLSREQIRAARAYAKKCAKHAAPIVAHATRTQVFTERDVTEILLAALDGHERVAKLIKSLRRDPRISPHQTKKQQVYELLAMTEQALIGVSAYCREHHLQDCSNCDDLKCCDNTYRQYHPRRKS